MHTDKGPRSYIYIYKYIQEGGPSARAKSCKHVCGRWMFGLALGHGLLPITWKMFAYFTPPRLQNVFLFGLCLFCFWGLMLSEGQLGRKRKKRMKFNCSPWCEPVCNGDVEVKGYRILATMLPSLVVLWVKFSRKIGRYWKSILNRFD